MKRSVKEWGLRILILMAGLTVAHLGVTLFLLSDLGSDPFNVFVQGSFRTLTRVLSGASLALRFCMLVAGCVILAFGMTMVIRSDAGTGPNDLVALVISEKTVCPLRSGHAKRPSARNSPYRRPVLTIYC